MEVTSFFPEKWEIINDLDWELSRATYAKAVKEDLSAKMFQGIRLLKWYDSETGENSVVVHSMACCDIEGKFSVAIYRPELKEKSFFEKIKQFFRGSL